MTDRGQNTKTADANPLSFHNAFSHCDVFWSNVKKNFPHNVLYDFRYIYATAPLLRFHQDTDRISRKFGNLISFSRIAGFPETDSMTPSNRASYNRN
ncbi:MAG: hypothetical protein GY855_04380 [candidate division Zixibacteria bacterium]|nr:hypothetical protein [candidate division Zixibacteria bacterium]